MWPHIPWNKNKPLSVETRAKMSVRAKARYQKKENHPFYGLHHSEETKEKIAHANKGKQPWLGRHHSEETKAKIRQTRLGKSSWNKGRSPPEETRKKLSKAQTDNWRDPQYTIMMMKQMHIRPTRPERKLEDILNRHFPRQYKYTGDGKLVIHGMRPDFANCNGKKLVIELFGDYWHSKKVIGEDWRRSELGKIMAYNNLGYRCLVIWEHELQDEQKVIHRIQLFMKGH